jgi:homocysteine S-methyltransferase
VLEDVFQVDTASSLWSSEALIKYPHSVIEAHLMFLRAGARLIETASWVIDDLRCGFDLAC